MTNLILKIVLTPVIVIISDMFSANQINYGTLYEAIIIGVIAGVVNFCIDKLLLMKGTLWVATIADFVITLCVIFFGTMLYKDAFVGAQGALVIAIIVAAMEYVLHVWLLHNDFRGKTVTH